MGRPIGFFCKFHDPKRGTTWLVPAKKAGLRYNGIWHNTAEKMHVLCMVPSFPKKLKKLNYYRKIEVFLIIDVLWL